jgi:N-acetylglucosaminyldiphosphoundecaprenol N-acetyl-beta-D-mannosaminyltransferase
VAARTDVLTRLEGNGGHPRVNVLGVGIDAINMESALGSLFAAIERGSGGYVCVTGVHGVMEAQRDANFRRILNQSLLTTPDGMPIVWLGRAHGFRAMDRVYGPDLLLAVCKRSVEAGHSHFFFGGAPGVAERLRDRLVAQFPGLRVVGTDSPPFRPLTADEEEEVVRRIELVRPDFIWIGLSTPKQERLMARLSPRFGSSVLLGIGAAFDFHSGRIRQAPRWMQRSGLEWVFRSMQEPRRLLPRYLRNNVPFLCRIALQALGVRHYPPDG